MGPAYDPMKERHVDSVNQNGGRQDLAKQTTRQRDLSHRHRLPQYFFFLGKTTIFVLLSIEKRKKGSLFSRLRSQHRRGRLEL